jgi:hypothetical protein
MLRLSENELKRLNRRVEDDYEAAIGDHQRRTERCRRWYRMWRNLVDPPAAGEEDAPNFSVPLIQWQTMGKLATDMSSLLGADAEIIGKPTGPSDQRNVHKVGRYMTWRMFQSMRITNPLIVFDFRKILFGRTHAFAPYVKETYLVKDLRTGVISEEVDYEGPGFTPLWPDEFITPGETVDNLHQFSFVMRRFRVTPGDLLKGEREGRYFGIKENFQKLVDYAENQNQRESRGEEILSEKDEAEGVDFDSMSGRGQLVVHEWYGKWRMLKGKADGIETNLNRRNLEESELVVRRLPDLDMVVGVQDLMDIYPRMKRRRPFVEAALIKDGSYWSPGFGEILETIQDEDSVNHNLLTEAGEFCIGPLIFAKPNSGVTDEKFRYSPREVILTEDPAGVNVVKLTPNLEYAVTKGQTIERYAERVTAVSDLSLGRSSDQPNQPRTARGTIALLEQGNIRASLDTTVLREDVNAIAAHIWELDSEFSPEEVFFRVTEEDADGLFDTGKGGAFMTSKERAGRYDFDVKFATSVWSREAAKDLALQLYGLLLQNPLVATNPRALWLATKKVCAALGDDNFTEVIPEPPDLGQPKQPREEWTLALQGEDFHVNPMDNDDLHLIDHTKRLTDMKEGAPEDFDRQAMHLMVAHLMEHQKQKRTKMLMQAMAGQLAQSLASNTAETGGLQVPGQPAGLADVQATLANLTGQQPGAGPGGQPGAPGAPPGGAPI